jgi:LacI family transcriptional regulator, gluconate utilization system Gnt-I transcriptional repressor
MSKRRPITLKDIAARALVSKMTASRVFARPHLVDPVTRKRVSEAARTLNYIPDLRAASLSSGKTRTIGAVVSSISEETFGATLMGLTRAIESRGYQLIVTSSEHSPDLELEHIRNLLARRVDGLVLSSTEHNVQIAKLLENTQIPVVEIWDIPKKPINHAVGFSNSLAGEKVAHYFLQKGYKKFFFLGSTFYRDAARWAGFKKAIKQATGREPSKRIWQNSNTDPNFVMGSAAVEEIVAIKLLPCALFAADENSALVAIATAQKLGLKIPDDIAICGFGNYALSEHSYPTLTTVDIQRERMGRLSGEVLLSHLDAGTIPNTTVDVGVTIISRQSA